MSVFLLCYHSIAPCIFEDIIASAICHRWRAVSTKIDVLINLYRFPLISSVAFPVALLSIADSYSQSDCGYEHTLLLSSLSTQMFL